MADAAVDLQKQIQYYKKRVEELSGENVALDLQLLQIKQELVQKRKGFELLSNLQQSVATRLDVSAILEKTLVEINSTIGMDRTLFLVPTDEPNVFQVSQTLGYLKAKQDSIHGMRVALPQEIARGEKHLYVNQSTQDITPLVAKVRNDFELPNFVLISICNKDTTVGVLISGRLSEDQVLQPPLGEGDVNTFKAIAGFVIASVEARKLIGMQEVDRLKTEFFANISHEFRTPITLTIGPLEAVLSGSYGPVPEKISSMAEIMLRNQKRLLDLINQILDLAKLESGSMALKAVKVPNLNSIVSNVLDQFQSVTEQRKIDLKRTLDKKVAETELYIDVEKFYKLIFNLLSNAVKFTKQGSVELETKVAGSKLELSVRDTGIGIRADQLVHIFDRFRQADGSESREFAGTGIGLSLVKEIVTLHGGKIFVNSEYGKGTTFKVEIPIGKNHLDPVCIASVPETMELVGAPQTASKDVSVHEGVASRYDASEIMEMNRKTLECRNFSRPLLIYAEDNKDLRQFVFSILHDEFDILLAPDGKQGLDLARQHKIDVIMSDLMMPNMSGTEFLKAAKQDVRLNPVPFLILTAKSSMTSKIEELERGADDYLNKPFSELELKARLKNLVTIRKQQVRIKNDLIAAREIQLSLLPPKLQRFNNCAVEVLYHPCEELSGDFFDSFTIDDKVYAYVADVTSHGTASAQVTYLVKGIFQRILSNSKDRSLDEILQGAKAQYIAYGLEYSVGIQMMCFDTKSRELTYAASNAPPAIHVTAEKANFVSAQPGPVWDAKLTDSSNFPEAKITLKADERFFMFSDGCVEMKIQSGQQLGERQLSRIIKELPQAGWTSHLLDNLQKIKSGANFEDDITVFALTIKQ